MSRIQQTDLESYTVKSPHPSLPPPYPYSPSTGTFSLARRKWVRICGIVACAVLFYLFKVAPVWTTRQPIQSFEVSNYFSRGLEMKSNYTEWGLLGHKVKRLGSWGSYLLRHPDLDGQHFTSALVDQFPFMEHSMNHIYWPWSARTRKPQTGIVLSVGSGNFHIAAHLILNLRNVLGSKLPIEIAYAGDSDLAPEHRDFLGTLAEDVSFIDLVKTFPRAKGDLVGAGWAIKPFALLAASHPRTLLIDADALFLSKPDDLFTSHSGLASTGALYYHDRAVANDDTRKRDYIRSQLLAGNALPSSHLQEDSLFWAGKSSHEADSGLVAIDKSSPAHFVSLAFTAWMNTKFLRETFTHPLFYGDKETFWIAMELSSTPYSFSPWYAGSIGVPQMRPARKRYRRDDDDDEAAVTTPTTYEQTLCSKHMLHVNEDGTEPFWINCGVYTDKWITQTEYVNFTHVWWQDRPLIKEATPWWFEDSNFVCHKEKGQRRISERTRILIERSVEEAKRVDRLRRERFPG